MASKTKKRPRNEDDYEVEQQNPIIKKSKKDDVKL